MKCDVLVVGGGPSGSMAAKTASSEGLEVVLIEEHKEIGNPIQCGEGVNKFIFQDTGIKKDNSFIRNEINGTKIHFYDEVYDLNKEKWGGYTIDRGVFDRYLANQAKLKGAKVLTESKAISMDEKDGNKIVVVKTKKKTFNIEAKIVIGADGFLCTVGRLAGLSKGFNKNEIAIGYEFELSGINLTEDKYWHIAFGEEFPEGYAWIFPKGKKNANVGVAVSPKVNAKDALTFFMEGYPGIEKIMHGPYKIEEIRGGCIPISGPKSVDETVGNGILLVGDAAGMVDPITGEGIIPSIISGIAAGETVSKCIKKNSWSKRDLLEYREFWMNRRYIDTTLGQDLNELVMYRKRFYEAFTNKKIKRSIREKIVDEI